MKVTIGTKTDSIRAEVFTYTTCRALNNSLDDVILSSLLVVFTLRHSRHVGGRKLKISHQLLLFVHQQWYIAALLTGQLPSGLENETANRVVQAPVVQRHHCPLDKYYQTY